MPDNIVIASEKLDVYGLQKRQPDNKIFYGDAVSSVQFANCSTLSSDDPLEFRCCLLE